jgi:sugar/nucleoside kinase (ribokinase family)
LNSSLTSQSSSSVSSPLTYIMIHEDSRTCIHSPMEEEITLEETMALIHCPTLNLSSYGIIHYDSRHTASAGSFSSLVCKTAFPNTQIIQSIDLEKPRPYLERLLKEVHVIFTNEKALQLFFPATAATTTVETERRDIAPEELMLNFFTSSPLSLTPNCRIVICTLGERGSLLICPKDSPYLHSLCPLDTSSSLSPFREESTWISDLASRVPITASQQYGDNFHLIRSPSVSLRSLSLSPLPLVDV